MPNHYEISPADDTLALHDGKGSASVAVRYVGDRSVEARASARPMEGADQAWLSVASPQQRNMRPGQTQTFQVTVAVPPGTPPGRYGWRLDVVSVANPDEEYDRGPLVTFEVEQTEERQSAPQAESPQPLRVHIKHEMPRWKIILHTFLLIFFLFWFGFLAWQMFGMMDRFDHFGDSDIDIDKPAPVAEPL